MWEIAVEDLLFPILLLVRSFGDFRQAAATSLQTFHSAPQPPSFSDSTDAVSQATAERLAGESKQSLQLVSADECAFPTNFGVCE